MHLEARAASCGHPAHSPAALASLSLSLAQSCGTVTREGGHREAGVAAGPSPSPPGLADSCGIARRTEPFFSFKVVATVNLVLEPCWASVALGVGTGPWLCQDVPATEMRRGRRPAQLPSDGQRFLLIVKLAFGFHSIQTASWDFVFLFSQIYKLGTTFGALRELVPGGDQLQTPGHCRTKVGKLSAPANGGTQDWQSSSRLAQLDGKP